jgi:DNA-binding IclR family transcriptional regulator
MDDGSTSDDDARDLRQGIQSVEQGARILEALASGSGAMTLGEVASRAGLQSNKVHRYLVSLIRVGLATQSTVSGRYDLGPALRRIGAEALRRTNEVAIASEYSAALRDKSSHSVNLAVWGDDAPLIVRWDYGSHALPLTLRVGTELSLLDSAAGRVFLAHLPDKMTADSLARAQRASLTPMNRRQIDAFVAGVRTDGYAVMMGALIPGATAISAPIFTAADMLPLVMTIILPGELVDPGALAEARSLLVENCRQLSAELGAISA